MNGSERRGLDRIVNDERWTVARQRGEGTSIIHAMITLAQSLELDTVAEGIETTQQLETLRSLGCTNGQGFLWSRSLHPDDALQWILRDSDSRPPRPLPSSTPLAAGLCPEHLASLTAC